MATPYALTADGLELQMATNHFGPFALTGLLLPQLVASGDGRVVAVGSQASRVARSAPAGGPTEESGQYGRWAGYAKSKLADLMFVFELDRRARAQGLPVKGLAAHPGYSATGLMGTGISTGSTRRADAVRRDDHAGGVRGRGPAGRDRRAADPDGGHRRPPRVDLRRPERRCAS